MMSFITSTVGTSSQAAPARKEESVGLLSDWTSYNQKDVETGGPSTSGGPSTLFQSVDKAGSKVSELFQNSFSSVKQGVANGVAALPSAETFR